MEKEYRDGPSIWEVRLQVDDRLAISRLEKYPRIVKHFERSQGDSPRLLVVGDGKNEFRRTAFRVYELERGRKQEEKERERERKRERSVFCTQCH